jgi:TolA-binding protein
VRWSAALALGQSGRTEAIAALQDVAKSDEAESVREAASEAVTKLQSTIPWLRSLPAALKQAKGLHKPVLAYFFVRGSDVCQQYEEGVLADKSVVDAAQEFVPVRIDAARNADEARRFDVRGAPTILILDAEGNEMSRAPGLMDTKTLLGKLAPTRAGKLSFREARRLALKDPSDVQANWKVAETYLEEGREDLAEPHLRNVIDHDEENQHGHTAHAIFALGFGLGKRGQYAQAAYSLEYLLKRWPQFKDKDKALYCLGLSELALGHKDKGRAALEQLIAEFPESSVVKPAQQSLEKLK